MKDRHLTKISIVGHFAFGLDLLNGQTIKTKILSDELEKRFGVDQVRKIDTHGGISRLLMLPLILWKALRDSHNVIILPAHNGIRAIVPILMLENVFFHRKLHYVVIGGWLPQFLRNHNYVAKKLKAFSGIYVETQTMKNELVKMGYDNILLMPNGKNLDIVEESELLRYTEEPFRICTFSRVMKEKGIGDAIDAVTAVNRFYGRVVYSLDIYGQVDEAQVKWFNDLERDFPAYVRYCGYTPYYKSVEVIRHYFAMLFPTHFYNEGIPGTILDAYAAGVPVVSAKWESFFDVVEDGKTGIGFCFDDKESLIDQLKSIALKPQLLNDMRVNCIKKARTYLPEIAFSVIEERL